MNFAELFFATAERHPERPFLLDDGGTHSYAACASEVRRAATLLQRAGIGKGDRVAVAMRNHAAFVVTWFALAALGAVMVAVNAELRGKSLHDVIADSGARTLVLDDELRAVFESAFGSELAAYCVMSFASPAAFFHEISHHPELAGLPAVAETDPFTILYSSGTTGRPKGALASHRAYVLAGRDMSEGLEMTPADRFYLFLPLYHANPQYYGVASTVTAGASLALARRFSASGFWKDVARYEPTLFTYVGSVLPILATLGEPARHSLRACVGGGVTPELWSLLEERWKIRILELYGMTETAGFATINRYGERKHGTVGRARPTLDVRILDGDEPVADGAAGEIVIRPRVPHAIFDGYLGAAAEETFDGAGFRTGDLGSRDAEGYYRYLGRAKEIIRVRGENIAPSYLEGLLRACPMVIEAAVVGVPSELGDDDLKLCVVPREGTQPEMIDAWCAEHLPRFMCPRYIELRSEIPKTSTMKIIRRELLEPSKEGVLWKATR